MLVVSTKQEALALLMQGLTLTIKLFWVAASIRLMALTLSPLRSQV